MNSTARRTSPLLPLLVVAIVLGYVAGLGLVIWGGTQKSRLGQQYKVQFLSEGDTCTKSLPLHLDVKSGKPMDCTSLGYGLVADVELPGFSDAETEKVLALATSLADGSWTESMHWTSARCP